jgi:hypothetical protein
MSGSNSSAPGSAVAADRAGPEPLGLTVHGMPRPSADDAAHRTRIGRLKMLLVVLVCAAPVIASYFTYYVIRPQGRTNYGELIEPQRPLPALPLADLQGRPVPAESLKHQWLFVAVSGGACDPLCERNLYLQRQLRETLGRDRDRMDKVWFVVDDAPVRPEVLAAIGDAQVLRVPREALAAWLAPAEGRALEEHLYVVDPMGHWMMRFPADPDASRIKRDLGRLMSGSRGWDQPGR